MNAQTPFDTDDYACAHGLYADEGDCPQCARLRGEKFLSPRRRLLIVGVLAVASWAIVVGSVVAVGVAIGKLTLSWLGVAL